ncbi:unnamed protein product [Durusdinium trenchii]|uniref:Uncharacterized protein n=2 Tax=Durusdinium trenchii TaxID=1381693 RepID=A0ABP0NLT8_9DINO
MAANESDNVVTTNKLMIILRKFDQEGSGTISRSQFEQILRTVLRASSNSDEILYKEEVDEFWAYFSKREDGDVEKSDLVDWILKPSTPLMLTESGNLAFFDLKSALQPLFQAYNQNGDGFICLQEFMDAHGILQIALRMNPTAEEEDPPVLRGDLHNCFVHIGDADKRLTFEKFVRWQRLALIQSALSPDSMTRLLKNVAKQIQRVFKLTSEKHCELTESDRLVLIRILSHLAQFSRELWGAGHFASKGKTFFENKWIPPFVGMNVDHLKEVFLHDFNYSRMRFSAKIVKRDWDILCIPGLPGRHQDWLARARLKNTLRSARFDDERGKQEEDQLEEGHIREVVDEQCYIFDREHFTWALAEESLFEKALEALSPEVKLFAILKTMANFGQRLSWPQLQLALSQAVQLDVISQVQLGKCNDKLEEWVLKGMDAEGFWCTRETLTKVREDLHTSPSQIMGIFAEIGAFAVTSIWADFMDTEK